MGVDREVLTFPDLEGLSRAAAGEIARLAIDAASHDTRFTLALSGGNTPKTLFNILVREYRIAIPWETVEFFWSDERYVPPSDLRSNYRMAREVLLDPLGADKTHIHQMPTADASPKHAAGTYESTLKDFFRADLPVFDLILLGMGSDGHTASLFPGSPSLQERERLVVDVRAPEGIAPAERLSLTLPVLNAAKNIFFLVAGADKHSAVEQIFEKQEAGETLLPAARVRASGRTVWFLDEQASPDPRW